MWDFSQPGCLYYFKVSHCEIDHVPRYNPKVFKKFKLTPYHIALFRTSDSKKGKFELTDSLLHKMDEMYIEDWTNIVNENSF